MFKVYIFYENPNDWKLILPKLTRQEFYTLLMMEDEDFLKHCTQDKFKGTGPGGQKRNKVMSGVRLIYDENQMQVSCVDERSARLNLHIAIRRLKFKLALEVHYDVEPGETFPFPGSNGRVNQENKTYPQFVNQCIGKLRGSLGQMRSVAETFGVSTSALTKIAAKDKMFWTEIQRIRVENKLKALKAP